MIEKEIDEMSPGEFDNVKFKNTLTKPKLTFFYEKNDETVFAAEEQEAANGKYNKKFKFVGWSDGLAYLSTIHAAKLRKGQVLPKEEAETLLRSAFEAELKVARKNLKDAKKNGTRIPRPSRVEWYFDSSVPEAERHNIAGGNYGKPTNGNDI
jgi:hypothetical protein